MADLTVSPNDEGSVVRKKSLKDEVFDLLHQRILAGKYLPGDWLRQEEISTQLGVSQTPVREALDLLVSVGLAERVPYRGVRVPEPTTEEIIDAYTLRLILESTAAHLAAQNVSAEELQALANIVEQTRRLLTLEDMSMLRQLNRRFHLLLVAASGNLQLSKLYEMASNRFPDWRLYEYMFRHPELLSASLEHEYDEHCAIVDALTDRDAPRAARQALIHIHNLAHELVEFLNIPKQLLEEREAQIWQTLAVHL
jgi:DNA-binding GntR family transcriptional regulator